VTYEGWKDFLEEFSVMSKRSKSESNTKKHAYDFIIKENIFNRIKYFYINHKSEILAVITIFVVILSIILLRAKIVDIETIKSVGEIFV